MRMRRTEHAVLAHDRDGTFIWSEEHLEVDRRVDLNY
jgi:hypothetical protein